MKKLLLALSAVPVLLVAGSASAWTGLDPSTPTWPQAKMPIPYFVNQASIPQSISGIGVARVDAGFATWGSPACTFWAASDSGNTASGASYNDNKSVILWISGSWPAQLGDVNSVIGVTTPVWDNSGNIFDADIRFNNVGFCWDDSGQGCVDTQSIATHEEGHFLGLGHTNSPGATMEPAYGGGTSLRSIETDDVNGVCALYPEGGVAAASSSSGGGGDCQTCADQSTQGACSGPYNTCGNSQDCVDFYNCYQNCSTDACVQQCANQYPTGYNQYVDLINCICDSACPTECAAECGNGGSSSSATTSGSGAGTTTSGSSAGSTTTTGGVGGGLISGTAGVGGSGAVTTGDGAGGDESKSSNHDDNQDTGCGTCAVGYAGSEQTRTLFLALGALGLLLARRRRR